MSKYDMAVGLDKTTLDGGTAQLYTDSSARENVFKGSETIQKGTAVWDVLSAPVFTLEPPPADLWAASITAQGVNPKPEDRPTMEAFQMILPQFQASYTVGTSTVGGTTQVNVFATVAVSADGTKLSFTPVAIWLDETQMKGWDKFVLNQLILKQIFIKANQLLSGIAIPVLSFSQDGISLDFTAPVITITGGKLIVAANLKGKGDVDIQGVEWPDQPLFLLLSGDVAQQAAHQAVRKVDPKQGSGSYGVLDYEYNASVNDVTVSVDSGTAPKVSAVFSYEFSGTVKPLGVGGPCAVSAGGKSL